MRYLPVILFILLLYAPVAKGQQFHAGLLPELSVSYKWTEKIQQTIKIESAHELVHPETAGFDYSHNQTDIQVFIEGRINPFIKIAGGYQYRLEGSGGNSHRLIQQIAWLQRKTAIRLGHRVRTDQTLYASNPLKWRFRYRLSSEIPLEGQSLDPGELYLLISGEPIYSLQHTASNLEIRLTSSLGYALNRTSSLEIGFDYRLESLLNKPSSQTLWLGLGWYYLI